MISALVMVLPNIIEQFVVEADAIGMGVWAILSQNKRAIALLSKALSPKQQILSINEKEMMAILIAVKKVVFLSTR